MVDPKSGKLSVKKGLNLDRSRRTEYTVSTKGEYSYFLRMANVNILMTMVSLKDVKVAQFSTSLGSEKGCVVRKGYM